MNVLWEMVSKTNQVTSHLLSEYQPPPVFFVDADMEITDYGAGYTALMAAAAVGAEEPLRLLIDKGR